MMFQIRGSLFKKIMALFSKVQGEADLVINKSGDDCSFLFVCFVEDCLLSWRVANIQHFDVPEQYFSCNTIAIADINKSLVINSDDILELSVDNDNLHITHYEYFAKHTKPSLEAFKQKYEIISRLIREPGSLYGDNYYEISKKYTPYPFHPPAIALFGLRELETLLNKSLQHRASIIFEIDRGGMRFIAGGGDMTHVLENKLYYTSYVTVKRNIALERVRHIKELKMIAHSVWIEYIKIDNFFGLRVIPISTIKGIEMDIILNLDYNIL